jgi:Bifunctional DNA primase/polymerase, N-terminal/Helicase conserved C-terminal domain
MISIALDYAAQGWAIFPCRPAAKEPATRRGFKDATTNPATIRRWWLAQPEYNIGIATGSLSSVLVLDVDGAVGATTLVGLEATHGPLPGTLTSITGSGCHLWFRIADDVPSSAGSVGDGLDIRAAGGYVLAPPSVHPDGPIYRWSNDLPPVPAPDWLLKLARTRAPKPLSEALQQTTLRRRNVNARVSRYALSALESEIEVLASAPEGTRNHALNKASFSLHQLVAGGELDRAVVHARLIDAATANGLMTADRMDRPQLIGDIVSHWHKYGVRRKTVAFAVNVAHSIHLRDEFIKSGVRAEHIDGGTPKPERDASLSRLASGEIEMITNCMVLTEGWDMPEVGCCILARPTKKMGLYRQMIGRVLRPADGKTDAIILDHSGAVFRHGFAEDPIEWTLDPDLRSTSAKHEKRQEDGSKSRLLECTQCSAIRIAGEPCPACGFLPQAPPKPFHVADGDLGLVEGRRAKAHQYSPIERAQWLGMFTQIAADRGYKAGWAAVNYKQKFGEWPPQHSSNVQPITPTPEVLSWVRSRLIAYAKGRGWAA